MTIFMFIVGFFIGTVFVGFWKIHDEIKQLKIRLDQHNNKIDSLDKRQDAIVAMIDSDSTRLDDFIRMNGGRSSAPNNCIDIIDITNK